MKFVKSLALVAVLAIATAGFAQEAKPEEKVPEKPKISVGGRAFLEYSKELKNQDPTATENIGTFELKRVYLDFRKKLDDIWSVRVTTDVAQNESRVASGSSTGAVQTNAYTLFIKYAYIEAKETLNFGSYSFQFGMIGTPLIGFVDKQSDYRWLEQNYVDQARSVLNFWDGTNWRQQSIDNSADMGVGLELTLFNKLLKLNGAYVHGEGFRRVNETQTEMNDDGKAYYGMITLMPIKNLNFFGAMRYEDVKDKVKNTTTGDIYTGKDNYRQYMAAGISYSDDWYKIGAMYILPETKTTSNTGVVAKNKYKLFDSWLHVRLDEIISMPVIVVGRYSFGKNDDLDKSKVTVWSTGLGYHITNGLRAVVYYQNMKQERYNDPDRTIFVKTEVNF